MNNIIIDYKTTTEQLEKGYIKFGDFQYLSKKFRDENGQDLQDIILLINFFKFQYAKQINYKSHGSTLKITHKKYNDFYKKINKDVNNE